MKKIEPILSTILSSAHKRGELELALESLLGYFDAQALVILPVNADLEQDDILYACADILEGSVDSAILPLCKTLYSAFQNETSPIIIDCFDDIPVPPAIELFIEEIELKGLLALPVRFLGEVTGCLFILRCREVQDWEQALVEQMTVVSEVCANAMCISENSHDVIQEDFEYSPQFSPNDIALSDEGGEAKKYRRLVEHSDAIIFHTDSDHVLSFVSKRALDFFGIAPEEFVGPRAMRWWDLVHPEDQERIESIATDMSRRNVSFDEEFRVINKLTGQVRWLLVRLVPVKDEDDNISGWDGFGVDISARHQAQDALLVQSKKIRALYTVSTAIRGYLDPSHIATRGLHALCDAADADAGACYLYPFNDSEKLDLLAQYGLSAKFPKEINTVSNLPNLCSYVATNGQPVVVPDVKNDPRAGSLLIEQEGIRSAVLVPISVEDDVLGTLALFSKDENRFDGGDVMLVSAAANQIGLAARQAHLFAAYKKQTRNLSALYRVNRELSGNQSMDEIYVQAFNIIHDELGLKRLWLGLLNDTGTKLIGQAAFGPGLRRRLVELEVDLTSSDNLLRNVLERADVITIEHPAVELNDSGIAKIFSRLDINSVTLVPLQTGKQVIGILAVQPDIEEPPLDNDNMLLLRSLASEIASVLRHKRIETRLAESEKMKTTGFLAAGIAHNFNNMLQAILGQASLLEIQADKPEKVKQASKLINDVATKGATLVRQLMSFAQLESPSLDLCDVNYVVERTVESLGLSDSDFNKLSYGFEGKLPRTQFDASQLRQIITNVLRNALDAVGEDGSVEIRSEVVNVDEKSIHAEVPIGKYVRLSIHDDGRGMDEETRMRCFEPFYTTKDVDPVSGLGLSGSGLGLAASYALAQRNGGSLVIESRLNYGTTVSLYMLSSDDRIDDIKPKQEISNIASIRTASKVTPLADLVTKEIAREKKVIGDGDEDDDREKFV